MIVLKSVKCAGRLLFLIDFRVGMESEIGSIDSGLEDEETKYEELITISGIGFGKTGSDMEEDSILLKELDLKGKTVSWKMTSLETIIL